MNLSYEMLISSCSLIDHNCLLIQVPHIASFDDYAQYNITLKSISTFVKKALSEENKFIYIQHIKSKEESVIRKSHKFH